LPPSQNNIEGAQISVILVRGFAKMLSKQVKNTVAVLEIFDTQKASVTSNKNNWATYTANKEKD